MAVDGYSGVTPPTGPGITEAPLADATQTQTDASKVVIVPDSGAPLLAPKSHFQGVPGQPGADGDGIVYVYSGQTANVPPPAPISGASTAYDRSNGNIQGLNAQWGTNYAAAETAAGNTDGDVWVSVGTFGRNAAGNDIVVFTAPARFRGNIGPQGPQGAVGNGTSEQPATILGIAPNGNANTINNSPSTSAISRTGILGSNAIGNFVGVDGVLPQSSSGVIRRFILLTRIGELGGGDTNFTITNGGLQILVGAEKGIEIVMPLRVSNIARSTGVKLEVYRRRGTGVVVPIAFDEPGHTAQDNPNYDSQVVFRIRNGLENNDILFLAIELERNENASQATLHEGIGQDGAGVQYGYIGAQGGVVGPEGPLAAEERLLPTAGAKDTIPYKVAADGSAVQFRPAPAGLNASQIAAINQSFLYAFQLVGHAIETASGLVGRHSILVQPLNFAPFNTFNSVRIRVGGVPITRIAYDSADTDRFSFVISASQANTIRASEPNATNYLVEIDFYTEAVGVAIATGDDGDMQIDQYLRVGADVVSRGLELVWQSEPIAGSVESLANAILVPIANEESGAYIIQANRSAGGNISCVLYYGSDLNSDFASISFQYDLDEPIPHTIISANISRGEPVVSTSAERVRRPSLFFGQSAPSAEHIVEGELQSTYLSPNGIHMHIGRNNSGNIQLWREK